MPRWRLAGLSHPTNTALANPQTGLGDTPLIFPHMFTDKERQILYCLQCKIRLEQPAEYIACHDVAPSTLKAAKPVFHWCKFLQPGVGRGDEQLSARMH